MKRKSNRLTALFIAFAMVLGVSAYAEGDVSGYEEEIIFDFTTLTQESTIPGEDSPAADFEEAYEDEDLPEDGIITLEPTDEDEELSEEPCDESESEEPEDEIFEEPADEESAEEDGDISEKENTGKPVLRVWITSSLEGFYTVQSGTEITLTAHLEGFENISYRLQWQYSLDGENWRDEPGANELTYSFILTEANDEYIWRVIVILT